MYTILAFLSAIGLTFVYNFGFLSVIGLNFVYNLGLSECIQP